MKRNLKTVIALSMCAVLTIGLSTIASCSADEDYSAFAGDELETLAEGDMNVGIEGITPGGATQQVDFSIQSDQIENYCGVWSVNNLRGDWDSETWRDTQDKARLYCDWNGTSPLNQQKIQELSIRCGVSRRWIADRVGATGSTEPLIWANTTSTGAVREYLRNLAGTDTTRNVNLGNRKMLVVFDLNHCAVGYRYNLKTNKITFWNLNASDLSTPIRTEWSIDRISDIFVYTE